MSRYCDDYADESSISAGLWWATIERSLNCPRGQKFLAEFERVLLDMPEKRLIEGDVSLAGDVCAIGAYARAKNPVAVEQFIKAEGEDPSIDATADLGVKCGIARSLAWGIAYNNDETFGNCTPEDRYFKTLEWVRSKKVATK